MSLVIPKIGSHMQAIIVGGGIGGLTAAIALEKVGIEAHVYERAPELREVGAGISLWANAISVRALQAYRAINVSSSDLPCSSRSARRSSNALDIASGVHRPPRHIVLLDLGAHRV